MAANENRAQKYAEWIVQNQDKKGTPEFETVANAYKAARDAGEQTPAQPESDPSLLQRAGRAFDNMSKTPGSPAWAVDPRRIEPLARGTASAIGLGVPADVAGQAVGGRIAQGIQAARGQEVTPVPDVDTMVDRARTRGSELREEYPLTSLMGGAVGAVGAARRLPAGKGALSRFGIGAGGAGAEGAAFAASEKGEDILQDAGWSALLGGGLSSAGPAVVNGLRQTGGAALRRFFKDEAAARLALERMKIPTGAVDELMEQFKTGTGREASLLDVADPEAALELQRISSRSSEAQVAIQDAAEEVGKLRQTTLPPAIRGKRPVATPGEMERGLKAEFKKSFDPIRNEVIDYAALPGQQQQILSNAADVLPQAIPGSSNLKTAVRAQQALDSAETELAKAQNRAAKAMRSGDEEAIAKAQRKVAAAEEKLIEADAIAKEYPVTMDVLDSARFDIGTKGQFTIDGGKKGQITLDAARLSKSVGDIGRDLFPEYGDMLKTYANRSRRAEAAFGEPKTGKFGQLLPRGMAKRVVSGGGNPESIADAIKFLTPAAKKGTALGSVQQLASAASQSPEKAAKLVSNLSRNSALQRSLRKAIGKKEAARIIDIAKMEHAANVNFRVASSGSRKAASDVAAQEASEALRGLYSSKLGGAAMANLGKDVGDTFLVPPKVAERLSKNLIDPNKAQETLKTMRRLAKNDEAVLELLKRNAVAAALLQTQAAEQLSE